MDLIVNVLKIRIGLLVRQGLTQNQLLVKTGKNQPKPIKSCKINQNHHFLSVLFFIKYFYHHLNDQIRLMVQPLLLFQKNSKFVNKSIFCCPHSSHFRNLMIVLPNEVTPIPSCCTCDRLVNILLTSNGCMINLYDSVECSILLYFTLINTMNRLFFFFFKQKSLYVKSSYKSQKSNNCNWQSAQSWCGRCCS